MHPWKRVEMRSRVAVSARAEVIELGHARVHELMELFVRHLADIGRAELLSLPREPRLALALALVPRPSVTGG